MKQICNPSHLSNNEKDFIIHCSLFIVHFFRMKKWLTPIFIIACIQISCSETHHTKVTQLQCCNLVNPEGVDQALLSWKIESTRQAVIQSAYEIEIASSQKKLTNGEADILKNGKQISDKQIDIKPSGVTFKSGACYWWRVRIWDGSDEATAWSAPATFSVGPQNKGEWEAKWITAEWPDQCPMPYFRKEFDASKSGAKVERAVVYLCGLGCSDLYLNGKIVDETRILDPAQSNYEQYALYSTFDVTSLIQKKENCIGVMLGAGWYNQDRVWGEGFNYGKPLLLCQLEILYDDGSRKKVCTDESWQWTPGPVLRTNIYAGEVYDANKTISGWAKAGTKCDDWKNARIATGIVPPELRPQLMEPIRLHQEITPVALWQTADGKWVFDFGVNIAAVPRITVKQPKGTNLKMCMGEYLNDDKTVDFSTTGVFATGVVQTNEYICNGTGVETWTPRFTYHGFRYLELSGMTTPPDKSWIKAVLVYNDVRPSGTFECSEPQINRLHEMAIRTMLSNTHGLPTDCPHRERCGWLGDAHTVAPFENFNFNLNNFWMKYMDDIQSTSSVFLEKTLHQKLHNNEFYYADKLPGIPFMIAPGRRLCGVASPDWGTAVVQLPWFTYLYFGNTRILERHYPQMKQWVDHISALTEEHIVPYGLGDWCPPEGNHTIDCPIPLSSTAFHYYDASILSQVAQVLGKKEDAVYYADLKEEIGKALIAAYYNDKTFGSQTADAMALDFGIVPVADRKAVSDAIVSNIYDKYDGFIHTGIFGLGRIGQALSRYGNSDAAWKVFSKKGENSFEWMWTSADATTLWEVLPVSEKSKNAGKKASLNHPMQGGFDAWFYEDIAGIRPDISGPGYKVTRFEPTLTGQLQGAKASIETPYGQTVSDWTHTDGKLQWKIMIPPNTSGLVALPKDGHVKINQADMDTTLYVVVEEKEQTIIYRFLSGTYMIEID